MANYRQKSESLERYFKSIQNLNPLAKSEEIELAKMMNQLIDTCGRVVRIPVNQEYKRYLALKKGEEVKNLTPIKIDDFVQDENGKSKADSGILSVGPSVEDEHTIEDFKVRTTDLLSLLKDRDRNIIKLYFGIDCPEAMPTKDIASKVELTQIRVCQIINTAKKQLQSSIK